MSNEKANGYFKLYGNCIPVKGALRSMICDLQMGSFKFIPNDLYEIIYLSKEYSISEIKEQYQNQFNDIIDEYYSYLIGNDLGHFHSNKDSSTFPDISLEWDEPAEITNCIIDFNTDSAHDFATIFSQIENLGCKNIQLRFYTETNITFLYDILSLLNTSRIKSVELLIKNNSNLSNDLLVELCDTLPRIKFIIIHSSINYAYQTSERSNNMGSIIYVKDELRSENHCGIIEKDYFRTNLSLFTESQKHNTCLNRKISIDANGEIKNCPSIGKSYGNIRDTTLQEALNKSGFKKLWQINKDQIEVCKDCEFRHICTDCRAYIEKPDNIYSKPLKCGYNPYTAEWEEWSTNPLKQKAIKAYKLENILSFSNNISTQ